MFSKAVYVSNIMEAVSCPQRRTNLFTALKACSSSRDLEKGKALHSSLIEAGDDVDVFVASKLINMYANCGSLEDAQNIFDKMKYHDVVSWTALILGYAENGKGVLALEWFCRMELEGCEHDALIFVAVIKACLCVGNHLENFVKGLAIHLLVVTNGWDSDLRVANTLMDMYIKFGRISAARRVFDTIKHPNVVSWNALMFGYADNGESRSTLNFFWQMQCEGYEPNTLTFVAALKACSNLALGEDVDKKLLRWGKTIHLQSVNTGCGWDYRVTSILVDMYAKIGNLDEARRIFDKLKNPDVVTWTALMLGYADHGKGHEALGLFSSMQHQQLDALTFVAALKACCSLADQENGMQFDTGSNSCIKVDSLFKGMLVHSQAVCSKCASDTYVISGLIDMYASCGSMRDAQHVLERSRMKHCDVVSWNALLFGYVDNGDGETALEMFARMGREGCAPAALTFVAALKACSMVGGLEMGKKLHVELCMHGFDTDPTLTTCLIDFYGKCGSMSEAQKVFDSTANLHLDAWNALMAAYSHHGEPERVFETFSKMENTQRLQPDYVTFVSLLSACRNAGYLEKAKEMFMLMSMKYGIQPGVEHYSCLVDILGRANRLNEAVTLAKSMPVDPTAVTWTAILASCLKWKNVEVGKFAFDILVSRYEEEAGTYVLMANIYKSRGMLKEQEKLVLKKSSDNENDNKHTTLYRIKS